MNLGQETEQIEFKESTSRLKESLIDVAAILNKHSGGLLYFGVRNDGEVCGQPIGPSTLRDIARKIYENIKPQIYPTITIESDGDCRYIKVEFKGNDKPYACDGRYYLRVHDESQEMSPFELAHFILNGNYVKWEKLSTSETIADVDEKKLKWFLQRAIECGRMPQMDYDRDVLMGKLHLLSQDGMHLNHAGELLFSANKPIKLKMAVFLGNDKTTFIDMNPVSGNIFELLIEAENYFKSHLNWSARFEGFQRINVPEIPMDALREAVANAFAHASYLGNGQHEIDIHPNRVAIFSPGSFASDLSPEDFVAGNMTSSIRNEIICDVLFKCNVIESWASGLKKIDRLCRGTGIKTDYLKEPDGFWFIFFRNRPDLPLDSHTEGLSETDQQVLALIKNNQKTTISDLAYILGKGTRTIQRSIERLKNKKLIVRVGSNKGGYWTVSTVTAVD